MSAEQPLPETQKKAADEHRRCRRHPTVELKTEFKIKKGLFSGWVSVEPCDFNKRGIAIETDHSFQPEDSILLKITLTMAMGDICVDKVEGIIKNRVDSGPHPRYGVEFDYSASRHMKSIDTQGKLGRIEGILERSENLRLRMDEQKSLDQA
jgi:hypothetical protein